MAEDFDNHRWIFDACPERVEGAAMIFKAPPQFGQCSMSMSKTRLSSRGPAHARRFSVGSGVIGRGLGGTLCRSGNDFYCATSRWVLARHGSESDVSVAAAPAQPGAP